MNAVVDWMLRFRRLGSNPTVADQHICLSDRLLQPQVSPAYSLLIFAWSATEVVRYLYYALNLVGIEPFPLLWARYVQRPSISPR